MCHAAELPLLSASRPRHIHAEKRWPRPQRRIEVNNCGGLIELVTITTLHSSIVYTFFFKEGRYTNSFAMAILIGIEDRLQGVGGCRVRRSMQPLDFFSIVTLHSFLVLLFHGGFAIELVPFGRLFPARFHFAFQVGRQLVV